MIIRSHFYITILRYIAPISPPAQAGRSWSGVSRADRRWQPFRRWCGLARRSSSTPWNDLAIYNAPRPKKKLLDQIF